MSDYNVVMLGGIWKTAGVDEQPHLTLICWQVLEITQGVLAGKRHLVGYCVENREGRASTHIVDFDRENMVCLTRSGRRYHLKGNSGYDSDGNYVWAVWSQNVPTKDVSDEYK